MMVSKRPARTTQYLKNLRKAKLTLRNDKTIRRMQWPLKKMERTVQIFGNLQVDGLGRWVQTSRLQEGWRNILLSLLFYSQMMSWKHIQLKHQQVYKNNLIAPIYSQYLVLDFNRPARIACGSRPVILAIKAGQPEYGKPPKLSY